MTVYVDTMRARLRRTIMCHMIADTEEELHAMAERIGVTRNWYQRDHYDIAMSKKKLALAAGARQISLRQLACMVWLRRHGHAMGDPETAEPRYRRQRAAAVTGMLQAAADAPARGSRPSRTGSRPDGHARVLSS